ncbi:MAG: YbaK/EbsC family protein [Hyphomicrobiales bacterium]
MSQLPRSARRVEDAGKALGLHTKIVEMEESTRTAEEAADACGCAVGQIVKSLVFQGADSAKPYLLLVSGTNRVNEKAVARVLGESLKRPNADFVREVTGYAIGGIPPFGHDTALATFIDADLLQYSEIWAAAGTPKCVMKLQPAALKSSVNVNLINVN